MLIICTYICISPRGRSKRHRETEKPQAFPVRLCGPAGLEASGLELEQRHSVG